MTDILTDAREPGWFWMEDAIIDVYGSAIGALGVAIYAYLARRADKHGVSFPSYQTIANDLALSRRTVITYIHKLEERGLIVTTRRNGKRRASNEYRLVNLRNRSTGSVPTSKPPSPGGDALTTGASVSSMQAVLQTGEVDAPINRHLAGAMLAPMQEIHQGSATDAPVLVQALHPTGAAVAPEGNTHKETQLKETQGKERKNGSLAMNAGAATDALPPSSLPGNGLASGFRSALSSSPPPSESTKAPRGKPEMPDVSPVLAQKESAPGGEPSGDSTQGGTTSPEQDTLADLVTALAAVTGKDLALLRPSKQADYELAARRLQERDFRAQDVSDFAEYWRQAHPIGSNKPNAGYPHLVQVLEDLHGAMPLLGNADSRDGYFAHPF